MNFKTFYHDLSSDDRKAFADKIKTSCEYIECHYLGRNPKIPRASRLRLMAEHSDGNCSYDDLLSFFYQQNTHRDSLTNPHGEESEDESKIHAAKA